MKKKTPKEKIDTKISRVERDKFQNELYEFYHMATKIWSEISDLEKENPELKKFEQEAWEINNAAWGLFRDFRRYNKKE